MSNAIVCLPKSLPHDLWVEAARTATRINPVNHPPIERLGMAVMGFVPTPDAIAVLTTKYWHTGGVSLTVGFLDGPSTALRKKILLNMNAWAKTANVRFVESKSSPQVRIARAADGYWSYIGTDILHIAPDQPTMNLEAFSESTPDSEFHRVVRHETGHTMGFPHEHMRRELVAKIDPQKAIQFFGQTQGWDPAMVRRQVLTPVDESSLLGTDHADPKSIMCYQIPGSITKDGKPILGGTDIDVSDYTFVAKIYPKKIASHPATKTAKKRVSPPKARKRAKGTKLARPRGAKRRRARG